MDATDFEAIATVRPDAGPDLTVWRMHGRVLGVSTETNVTHQTVRIENADTGWNVGHSEPGRQGCPRLLISCSSCMYLLGVPSSPLTEGPDSQPGEPGTEPNRVCVLLAKMLIARLCQYVTREAPHLSYKAPGLHATSMVVSYDRIRLTPFPI